MYMAQMQPGIPTNSTTPDENLADDWFNISDFLSSQDTIVRQQMVAASAPKCYRKGETVYFQEDEADHLYFLAAGYVRLSSLTRNSAEFTYAILRPGDTFGELGVFQRSQYADTAIALNSVTAYRIRRDVLNMLSRTSMPTCQALSDLVAERFRTYVDATRCLTMNSLSARLAETLLRLGSQIGEPASLDGRPAIKIGAFVTQSDIGGMVRSTRSNVNRCLKEWERAQAIRIQDRSIIILNTSFLERIQHMEDGAATKF